LLQQLDLPALAPRLPVLLPLQALPQRQHLLRYLYRLIEIISRKQFVDFGLQLPRLPGVIVLEQSLPGRLFRPFPRQLNGDVCPTDNE